MMLKPGNVINEENHIYTYFSEDYCGIRESFQERGEKVLYNLVEKIFKLVKSHNTNGLRLLP